MAHENNSPNPTKKVALSDHKSLMDVALDIKDGQSGHKKSIPPIEQWHPKHCGTMNLLIKANGEWWHDGQLIKRKALIDLFSTLLWKADGKFYLKTPVEQIEIEVEDEPLLVNQVDSVEISGKVYLQLTTVTDDVIIVDDEHPIFMREYAGELRPYVYVRFGMNALIQRASFFHLVELGELIENEQGETSLLLKSGDLYLHLST